MIQSSASHVVALDLPGIGGSAFAHAPGDKRAIVAIVHGVTAAMGFQNPILVGHDIGGQVVFAALVAYPDELAGAVLMDMTVPGIDPWQAVISNPHAWHLAFHGIPKLPEALVHDKPRTYFDFFSNAVNAHPEAIGDEARASYVAAYSDPAALTAGFGWYRAFKMPRSTRPSPSADSASPPRCSISGATKPAGIWSAMCADYIKPAWTG